MKSGDFEFTLLADGTYELTRCENTDIARAEIPQSVGGVRVTRIGDRAFRARKSLVSAVIPEGVTAVGERAFSDCRSLEEVTVPDSVTELGCLAFGGSDRLTRLRIGEGNPRYLAEDGVIYSKDRRTLVGCTLRGAAGSFAVPDGVTAIGARAFSRCWLLTHVTLPGSVTHIGDRAFALCENLSRATLPEGLTAVGRVAFHCCQSLGALTLPASVVSVGEGAFSACGFITVNAPHEAAYYGSDVDFSDLGRVTWVVL